MYYGNNLDILPTLPDNSVDSIVTDPPYELGFMGKKWDSSGIAYSVELWSECLRVLKPGGHLLSFGGTRTWHRVAVAIEDAGFEVRDSIAWMYGSGFPKSLNLKDKWTGWGTALKPAFEPIVVARKPLIGTVAANVLKHGTGALNIDGSRIGTSGGTQGAGEGPQGQVFGNGLNGERGKPVDGLGRWPANVILDEYSAELLDEQSGILKSGAMDSVTKGHDSKTFNVYGKQQVRRVIAKGDSGGASRFFYCAKASKRDRNEGLEGSNFHPTVKPTALMRYLVKLVTPPNGTVLDPFTGSGSTGRAAILEGFDFIGIELTEDYIPIIEGRLIHAEQVFESKII